jgi:hypothetical protein
VEDIAELRGFLHALLETQYEGQWQEGLTNSINPETSYWLLRRQQALTHLHIYAHPSGIPMLQVTCGLAVDVPFSEAIFERLNAENSKVMFGRFFTATDEQRTMCAVVLQEIWPLSGISFQHQASLQMIASLVGSLTSFAEESASGLLGDLGGRPFDDTHALVLASIGG